MRFTTSTLLIATAWIASSCVIADAGSNEHPAFNLYLYDLRRVVTYCIMAYAVFRPEMKMRAFWIGFGILPAVLGDTQSWGLTLGHVVADDFGIADTLVPYINQFIEDAARCCVGAAAQCGYVRSREAGIVDAVHGP